MHRPRSPRTKLKANVQLLTKGTYDSAMQISYRLKTNAGGPCQSEPHRRHHYGRTTCQGDADDSSLRDHGGTFLR